MGVVGDLLAARMQEFQHITETQLPAFFEEFGLAAGAREALLGYVGELRDWMAGIVHWHQQAGRYQEATLRRLHPQAVAKGAPVWAVSPSGLGTAAARLAGLLAGSGVPQAS
jgi:germacradienol/geosmin synthase